MPCRSGAARPPRRKSRVRRTPPGRPRIPTRHCAADSAFPSRWPSITQSADKLRAAATHQGKGPRHRVLPRDLASPPCAAPAAVQPPRRQSRPSRAPDRPRIPGPTHSLPVPNARAPPMVTTSSASVSSSSPPQVGGSADPRTSPAPACPRCRTVPRCRGCRPDPAHTHHPGLQKTLQRRHGPRGRSRGHDGDPRLRQRSDQRIHHRCIFAYNETECAGLTITFPCIPRATVRSMMSSIENALPSRRVHANGYPRRTRTCRRDRTPYRHGPSGSRSIAHGSSPPTVSAPSRNASSSSFHRAGPAPSMPLCGNATRSISTMSASASRGRHQATLDAGHAALGVHVDVAADEGAAMRHRKARLKLGPCRRGSIGSVLRACALVLDSLSISRGPTSLRITRQAKQRFVEMGVGLYQTRQRYAPATFQDRHADRGRAACNSSCQDQNIRGSTPSGRTSWTKRSAAIVYPQSTRISQCAPRSRPAMVRAPI